MNHYSSSDSFFLSEVSVSILLSLVISNTLMSSRDMLVKGCDYHENIEKDICND